MLLVSSRPARTLLLAALLAACGGGDGQSSAEDSAAAADSASAAAAPEAPAPAAAAPTGAADAPITVADVDRWQRGMEAELKAVQEAGAQLKAARTANDTMTAMFAANETSTRAAGASAAGVDEERYGRIGGELSSLVAAMSPLEAEMDVSKMPAPMVATMNEERAKQLAQVSAKFPPELIEALRPRAADLRKQVLTLVGERLKAAGVGR